MRWLRKVLPAALLTALLSLAGAVTGAAPAQAHDVLRGTAPGAGQTVDQLPPQVVLTFEEPAIAVGTQIVVTGPAGAVQNGAPQLVDAEVRQPVRGGPAGRYTVSWRVTSADGHPISGSFEFTTSRASAAETTAPTSAPVVPSTTAGSSTAAPPASTGSRTSSARLETAAPSTTPIAATSSPAPILWVALVFVLLAATAALLWWRRRRSGGGSAAG